MTSQLGAAFAMVLPGTPLPAVGLALEGLDPHGVFRVTVDDRPAARMFALNSDSQVIRTNSNANRRTLQNALSAARQFIA